MKKDCRENFEKCGIEPDFKISDGSQQTETCKRVMSKLIAEYLEAPSNDFYRLLEFAGCEYDEKNLCRLADAACRCIRTSQNGCRFSE